MSFGRPYQNPTPLVKVLVSCENRTCGFVQQAKILQMAEAGKSLREIAREQNRDRRTVTKIVNQPEMRNILERVKSRLIQLTDNAAECAEFALKNEIDGKVALRLLGKQESAKTGQNKPKSTAKTT